MERIIEACYGSNNPTFIKNISLEFFEELSNKEQINEAAYLKWCEIVKYFNEIECMIIFTMLANMIRDISPEGQKYFWLDLEYYMMLLQNKILTYQKQKLINGEDPEIQTPEELKKMYEIFAKELLHH